MKGEASVSFTRKDIQLLNLKIGSISRPGLRVLRIQGSRSTLFVSRGRNLSWGRRPELHT